MALLASIARGGGAALWRDGGYYYEEGAKLAAFLLDDASLVRPAWDVGASLQLSVIQLS